MLFVTSRLADNHEGWVVQFLSSTTGWTEYLHTFSHSRQTAAKSMFQYMQLWPLVEFRVYPKLKEK